MYRLIFLSGRYQGKRLVVRQAITWLGHDPQSHLPLAADEHIAARHAQLEDTASGVYLSPVGDDTPIHLNGELVTTAIRLQHNDEFVLGNLRIQYQEIIAPDERLRPRSGLLQPVTLLLALGILVAEIILIGFMVKWPERLIRPRAEAQDIAQAEVIRSQQQAEKTADATAQASSPAENLVVLPGTVSSPSQSSADSDTPTESSEARQVLKEADFPPANPDTALTNLPQISAVDPLIEQSQRLLSEATTAIQFADYPAAARRLNQIHQINPGFAPAHVEHARLLEARGDLDAAHQRWIQIMGLVAADSAIHTLAQTERRRLADLRALQTQALNSLDATQAGRLPRQIRIAPPDIQKMPTDTNVEEMRILNAEISQAPNAPLFKDAIIQAIVTFYDIRPDGLIQPTRAIVHSSPPISGALLSGGQPYALQATYVVPPGLRTREEGETGQLSTYYGFTIHVFAGNSLQDAFAKPKKLLELPIQFGAENLP